MSGPLVYFAWTLVAIAAFSASILRGGAPRLAGCVAGLVWALSLSIDRLDWPAELALLFVVDLVLALFLVWMTRTNRAPWLIFTAASAVLLVVNYGVYAFFPGISGWAFVSVSWVWSACILLGLIWSAVVGERGRSARTSRP
jgi:hypothetical protein